MVILADDLGEDRSLAVGDGDIDLHLADRHVGLVLAGKVLGCEEVF